MYNNKQIQTNFRSRRYTLLLLSQVDDVRCMRVELVALKLDPLHMVNIMKENVIKLFLNCCETSDEIKARTFSYRALVE